MNASPSNNPQPTESEPGRWQFADLSVAGLWFAISIGLILGRQFLLPTFQEFDVPLPRTANYLLHFSAGIFVLVAAFLVALLLFSTPVGSVRRQVRCVAGIVGAILAAVCILACFLPLVSLWQDLS